MSKRFGGKTSDPIEKGEPSTAPEGMGEIPGKGGILESVGGISVGGKT